MNNKKEIQKKSNSNQLANDAEDKTMFERIEFQVKTTIFNVLYVLLKDDETVAWKLILMGCTDFFQIFQFTFLPAVQFPWRGAEVSFYYNTFLDFFQVAVWLGRLDFDSYIVVIYVGIFIVILIILDIFYVSYSFTRKKFAFVWPLQALRSSCGLFVTVLFLPFLESFTSMLYCVEGEDGNQYLAIFPTFVCWKGTHIIHVAFCIAVSIVFMIICIIVSLTFFDNNFASNDVAAKINSRADAFCIILKIILNYTYTFFGTQDYHWLLLAVLMILSYNSFSNFRYNWPYFDDRITKFYCCLTGTFLWGNINLFVIKILEGTDYDGGFQLYFLGLPLILGLIVFEPDERIKMLLKNINNFERGEQVALQIRYFIRLIQTKDTNRRNNIILKGYIYHHEDFCPNPNCQLKLYKQDFKNILNDRKKNKKLQEAQQFDDLHQILLSHAQTMYRQGIAKFPECATLKIQYALFLMSILDKQQDALIQLTLASYNNPSFDEQFVIFRLKKQIDDQSNGLQEGGAGLDLIAKLAFESSLKQCTEEMSKSAQLHYEFWNQLKNDRPDISKLNDIGGKINSSIKAIEDQFNYIQKINSNSARALRLYAKFLIEILNDQEKGMDYILRAKETVNSKQSFFEGYHEEIIDIETMHTSSIPCVFVDGSPDNIGIITSLNMSVAKLFGYNPQDLQGHSIDKLMPDVYQKNHSKLLEKACQSEIESVNNKERFIFGKHKSGYIFPTMIQLKALKNFKGNLQFIAIFKIDKRQFSSYIGYVLISKEKKVSSLTSSCQNLIGLDMKKLNKLNQGGYEVNKMCSELFDLEVQQAKQIDWILPDVSKVKKQVVNPKSNLSTKLLTPKSTFQGQQKMRKSLIYENAPMLRYSLMSSICPIIMGEFGEIGWYVKICQDDKLNNILRLKHELKKENKQPMFQFRYQEKSGLFVREVVDDWNDLNFNTNQELMRRLGITDASKNNHSEEDAIREEEIKVELEDKEGEDKSLLLEKKKWGRGINIYKLNRGKFYPKDYDEDIKKQQEAEEQQRKQIEEEEKAFLMMQTGEPLDPQSLQKTRKALQIAFNDKSTPRAITNLRIAMNLVIISMLILCITEFTINNSQFIDINKNFNLIRKSYERISEVQRIAFNIRTLININEKKQTVYKNYTTSQDFVEFLKQDIEQAMNSLYQLHGNITLGVLPMSDKQEGLLNEKTLKMYFRDKKDKEIKTLYYTLTEAVLQFSSAVFTARHLDILKYSESQEDLFFITYNSFNDFYKALENTSIYYVQDLSQRLSTKEQLLLIIFIISILVVLITNSFMLPMIQKVNQVRVKVLSLFVDIPQNNVEELSEKCEEFILNIDDDHNDEIETIDHNKTENQQGSDINIKQTMKKKTLTKIPKNASRSNFSFYVNLGITMSILLSYFIAMFILSLQFLGTIDLETKELNVLAQAEFQYAFAQNVQREMIYDPEKPIQNQNSFLSARDQLIVIDSLTKQILIEKYSRISGGKYQQEFQRIYQQSLCYGQNKNLIRYDLIPFKCETFISGTLNNGLQLVLLRYLETLKENLKQYLILSENSNYNQTVLQQNLFDSDRFLELYIIQFRVFQDCYRDLVEILSEEQNSDFQGKLDTRLAAFIVFIIGIVSFYLIIWIPYVNNLNNQIWRTKAMLTIIPLDVIIRMPKMQEFLNSQNFFSSKKNK